MVYLDRIQKVVTLGPTEEAEFERLTTERRALAHEHERLKEEAGAAIRARNATAKRLKAVELKWLVLAERKYPD